jgi:hypothetical protein
MAVGRDQVAVVDTPGFDDSTRSDAEILEEIVEFMCTQYELGIPLKGIVYLHRITDNKMSGSAQRYFEMFIRLCGEQNLQNVVLLTTMWSELRDEAVGLARERELRTNFWKVMESEGSTIRRFDGSKAMAEAFVCRLMRKPDIVLDIQNELVEQGKRLHETQAGRLILPRLEREFDKASDELDTLERLIKEAHGHHDEAEVSRFEEQRATLQDQQQKNTVQRKRLQKRTGQDVAEKIKQEEKAVKWKSRLSLFGTLLGVAISITVNVILPLAGVAI